MQSIFCTPLNGIDAGKGKTYGIRCACQSNTVTQFVTDEWLRMVKKHSNEHFVTKEARRYGPVVLIHNFSEYMIFKQRHALVNRCLGSNASGFRGSVLVERRVPPSGLDAPSRLINTSELVKTRCG